MLAIDIETTALEPEDGEIRLIQLSDGKRVIVYDVRNKPNYTLTSLTGVDELAAHNAPFEARWLREKLGIEIPDLHDTLVMSRVVYGGTDAANNRRFGHSLAAVVKRELGVDQPRHGPYASARRAGRGHGVRLGHDGPTEDTNRPGSRGRRRLLAVGEPGPEPDGPGEGATTRAPGQTGERRTPAGALADGPGKAVYPPPDPPEICARIRQLREEAGVKQHVLGLVSGVPLNTISEIAQGRLPMKRTVLRLAEGCRFLGCATLRGWWGVSRPSVGACADAS